MITKDQLIAAGVRNLKEFGYPDVTRDNILTDMIFRKFFRSMLEGTFGRGADVVVNALLREIDEKGDSNA